MLNNVQICRRLLSCLCTFYVRTRTVYQHQCVCACDSVSYDYKNKNVLPCAHALYNQNIWHIDNKTSNREKRGNVYKLTCLVNRIYLIAIAFSLGVQYTLLLKALVYCKFLVVCVRFVCPCIICWWKYKLLENLYNIKCMYHSLYSL